MYIIYPNLKMLKLTLKNIFTYMYIFFNVLILDIQILQGLNYLYDAKL